MNDVVSTAIRERLDERGKNQTWLAVAVSEAEGVDAPYSQSAASDWIKNPEGLRPERLFIIEKVLDLPPGKLSRHFGYIPADAQPVTSVLDAVDADPRLTEEHRTLIGALYLAAVQRR